MSAGVSFNWKNVVIGADLEAIEFAYDNMYFLIKNREPYHHSYEEKEEAWAKKLYELYSLGLSPFTDKVSSIRVDSQEKTLKVFSDNQSWTISYENLYQYDDVNVEGNKLEREILHYRVIDWFDCRGLYDLEIEEIITEEHFVNKIKFFKTLRVDGDQKYLDLLCESFLNEDQLKNFDYGETMARFKIAEVLFNRINKKVDMSLWKRDIYPVYKS